MDSDYKLDSNKITNTISPIKDVDGLHNENAGKLSRGSIENEGFVPCTARGCIEMIKETGTKVSNDNFI